MCVFILKKERKKKNMCMNIHTCLLSCMYVAIKKEKIPRQADVAALYGSSRIVQD